MPPSVSAAGRLGLYGLEQRVEYLRHECQQVYHCFRFVKDRTKIGCREKYWPYQSVAPYDSAKNPSLM
jgi:hypothetical protein